MCVLRCFAAVHLKEDKKRKEKGVNFNNKNEKIVPDKAPEY